VLAFLLSAVGVLVVGGLLFLGGSLLLGRGETQPPAELDRSPMELPDDRPVAGDDIRALRISPAVRGYRMTEVDWLLDQFAQVLDERDQEIAELRARLVAAQQTDRREPADGDQPGGGAEVRPTPADGERADRSPSTAEEHGGQHPGGTEHPDGAAFGGGPAGNGARLHA
jgi:DivIVA domain-containing protein